MHSLIEGTQAWGMKLSEAQLQAFQTYYEELVAWNARFNLTAITGYQQVQIRHFLDSLSCLLILEERLPSDAPPRVIDIGTGGGFPGIPLKLLRPDWDLTLVDSTRKKVCFLEHVVEALRLRGVKTLWARVEELGQDPAHREQYDVATARAVAELSVLAEYLLPLCRIGGVMIAPKGLKARAEVQAAERAIDTLGGRVIEMRRVNLPGLEETRYLIVVEKITSTPPRYPRRPGIPSKRPLP
ncbi:MAG: 16S rRNA (guanine(527)-N(7))-methyltransferase RsmG [Chloroflexota bacterium]|nr:16S rRNA (guanine(527)-N(7))-methyltransferase RsmG [Chloroflexota bacterium]